MARAACKVVIDYGASAGAAINYAETIKAAWVAALDAINNYNLSDEEVAEIEKWSIEKACEWTKRLNAWIAETVEFHQTIGQYAKGKKGA